MEHDFDYLAKLTTRTGAGRKHHGPLSSSKKQNLHG